MSAHAYHPHCGCDACCRVEEAEERRIEAFGTPMNPRREARPYRVEPYRAAGDLLHTVARMRMAPKWSAAFTDYRRVRERAMREPAGFAALTMCEAAIRCDLASREAVAAWRRAAA